MTEKEIREFARSDMFHLVVRAVMKVQGGLVNMLYKDLYNRNLDDDARYIYSPDNGEYRDFVDRYGGYDSDMKELNEKVAKGEGFAKFYEVCCRVEGFYGIRPDTWEPKPNRFSKMLIDKMIAEQEKA